MSFFATKFLQLGIRVYGFRLGLGLVTVSLSIHSAEKRHLMNYIFSAAVSIFIEGGWHNFPLLNHRACCNALLRRSQKTLLKLHDVWSESKHVTVAVQVTKM